MRTRLDIDDDVLLAAKELARRERKTAGQVLSELARYGLTRAKDTYSKGVGDEVFLGFRPFGCRGTIVTNAVNRACLESELMREHGIRRIASADNDFAKFSGFEVANPSRRA
jgi:hypothetical protein